MGLSLEKAGKEVLGTAKRILVTKDSTLIVTNGDTQKAVEERVSQIKKLIQVLLLSSSSHFINQVTSLTGTSIVTIFDAHVFQLIFMCNPEH